MRDHRSGREAARECVLKNRREASRSGSHRGNVGHRNHDGEEDHDAGAPYVRWGGPQAIRALLHGGAANGRLHGQRLRGHLGVSDRTVEIGEAGRFDG